MAGDTRPPCIIVCGETGDWIEWRQLREPEQGDCPHGACRCAPTLYERADVAGFPREA